MREIVARMVFLYPRQILTSPLKWTILTSFLEVRLYFCYLDQFCVKSMVTKNLILSYFWLFWGTPQPALSGSLEGLMHFFLIFGYYCEGDKRTKYSHISWCRIVFLALKHQCWIQCRSTGPSKNDIQIPILFTVIF